MRSGFMTLLSGMLLSAMLAGPVAASETPISVVRHGVNDVVALVKDESIDLESRREKMRGLIGQRFDFQAMSQSILARNWKTASPEQQERFVGLFRQLLENTYIAAIESYTSEEIRFGDEKVDGTKASVDVRIVMKSGSEAPLLFKLKHRDDKWHVYDVVIEGVSLVNNYRTSFRSVVHRAGIDGLLNQLDKKLNQG